MADAGVNRIAAKRGRIPVSGGGGQPSIGLVLGGGGARGLAHILMLEVFDELGARLWSERAQAELRRIGGRAPATPGVLTPTEERVAALVAAGGTYREVADALFISPKTVQWNLSKIYRKLGVRSRAELAAKLAAGQTPAVPPVPE